MTFPAFKAARPGERDLAPVEAPELPAPVFSNLVRQRRYVLIEQGHQQIDLRHREAVHRQAARCIRLNRRPVVAENVARGDGVNDRRFPLLRVHRMQQAARQVFFTGQQPHPQQVALTDLGRIGAEKGRGSHQTYSIHNRHMQRNVVTLDPPAPRRGCRWLTEHRDIIQLRIT